MLIGNMKRISVCQFSTFNWTFFEDVVRYSNHGFNSIGVWRRKADDFDTEAAADLLHDMKMSVSSIHWAGGFTGDGMSFSEAIEDATEAIQLASKLNAGCLILHPGSRNGHTTSHATRLFESAISELIPTAADYGVKLALEPMPSAQPSSFTFFDQFQDSISLLEKFPKEHLGLILDLYFVGFDSGVFEFLERFIDRVELVQLADRNLLLPKQKSNRGCESFRLPLGNGELPIEAWLSKLQMLGYPGQFELEVHGQLLGHKNYFQTLDQTSDYFSQEKIDALIQPSHNVQARQRVQLNKDD
ncbi:MAG: sugar phosphate isomerase/epimerase family protein [Mariniblastus sp.]